MTKITELEKEMLVRIINDYRKYGVENTEFHNTFGTEANTNKVLRGTFTSLKRKKIIDHYNDPKCFNPIFPTNKMIQICEENEIYISEETIDEMKRYITC